MKFNLAQAYNMVTQRIREADSRLLPKEIVFQHLNEAQQQVLKKRHFKFLDQQINFLTTPSTTLTNDVNVEDTSFYVNDNVLPLNGTVLINGDIITYGEVVVSKQNFTADAVNDIINITIPIANLSHVVLDTTGELPFGLYEQDYYAIYVSPTQIKLALTKQDAENNIAVDILNNGLGNNTITAYQLPVDRLLTGVQGISYSHQKSDEVIRLYNIEDELLISNFDKPIYLDIDGAVYEYYDGRGELNKNMYCIVNGFLYLPYSKIPRRVTFKYKIKPQILSELTDEFVVPYEYIGVIVEYALYKAKMDLEIPSFQFHLQEFKRIYNDMCADEANQTEEKHKRIKSIYQQDYELYPRKF